jgi:hypothetical protein
MCLQNKILSILILFTTILFTNCSPSRTAILNLKPQTPNNEWYKGKEIVTLDNDSIVIRISFDRSDNNYYVFDTEIINNSEKTILVDPEKFCYKIISGKIKGGDAIILTAKDPEKVILELQKDYAIHKNNMEMEAMANSFGYFLQFAGQTKALLTNDPDLSKRIDHQSQRMKNDEIINDIQNNRIGSALENSSYVWEILALRKTTLYPYQNISGKVFFPISGLAETLEFYFALDNQEKKLLYKQESTPLYEKYVNPNLEY